jgi:hypothetical protein
MPGTLMSEREWQRTKCLRKIVVMEFGLRSWDMLTAEQADAAVRIAATRGMDAADDYLAPINAANWSRATLPCVAIAQ